jgi:hypothetical protein
MEKENKHKTGNTWRDSNICKGIGVSPLVPIKHIEKESHYPAEQDKELPDYCLNN